MINCKILILANISLQSVMSNKTLRGLFIFPLFLYIIIFFVRDAYILQLIVTHDI